LFLVSVVVAPYRLGPLVFRVVPVTEIAPRDAQGLQLLHVLQPGDSASCLAVRFLAG